MTTENLNTNETVEAKGTEEAAPKTEIKTFTKKKSLKELYKDIVVAIAGKNEGIEVKEEQISIKGLYKMSREQLMDVVTENNLEVIDTFETEKEVTIKPKKVKKEKAPKKTKEVKKKDGTPGDDNEQQEDIIPEGDVCGCGSSEKNEDGTCAACGL